MTIGSSQPDSLAAAPQLEKELMALRRELAQNQERLSQVERELAAEVVRRSQLEEQLTNQKLHPAAVQERLLQALIDNIPDPTWLKDADLRFLVSNKATGQFYGRDRETLVGKTVTEISPEWADTFEISDRRVLHGKVEVRVEQGARDAGGNERWFETIKSPILDEHGRLTHIVGIARDITERRSLEQQLRQMQKLEAIGQLAGGVAHDFNNVLAVIRGYADLMLMEPELLSPEAHDGLNQILAAGERAANLTRQLLVFSRKQGIVLQSVSLNEVVANLLKMLKRVIGEHIALVCDYGRDLPSIEADTAMLELVLMNLTINARDAMPNGGHVLIQTQHCHVDAAHARSNPEARPGDFVRLTVRDTGTGIAREHLPRIFEPFFTTKEPGKGTGLGLATVYGIVKQHHGWIEVTTHPKVGTAFDIYFPATDTATGSTQPQENHPPQQRGHETILLVEDEASVRSIFRRVLENCGYKVLEACSAPEALEIWRSRSSEIALLLTDIVMPYGISGPSLAEQLQRERPQLKVVYMSGYNPEASGRDTAFLLRHSENFLQKPCPAPRLIAMVRRCLDAN